MAITMWLVLRISRSHDQIVVAVNSASVLGSKIVKEASSITGKDIFVGADALSKTFERSSGKCCFDNDSGDFREQYFDATNNEKFNLVVDS